MSSPWASALGALALALPLHSASRVLAEPIALKAVIFDEVKPFYQRQDNTYQGLGVDFLEQIRNESGRRKVIYQLAPSLKDGFDSIITGNADIACGVAFSWPRSTQVNYSLPFAISGTRLLSKSPVDGTPVSIEGKKIAVLQNSVASKVLKSVAPKAVFVQFETPSSALQAFNDGKVSILGGDTLWLAANSNSANASLVPTRPYGRSGMGCIVNQNNGLLLSHANLAIGQIMQAYIDGDAGTRRMINRWIGPDSPVGLKSSTIRNLYSLILSTTAEISTSVTPSN